MRETGTNALQYMKLYEETWEKLMTQQHQFAIRKAAAPSILTTWTISFNDLQEKCQEAANFLILWAFLDNQDIWYKLFTPALDLDLDKLSDWLSRCVGNRFKFKKCTRLLIRYSFVTANIESFSFSVRSVVHRWCFHSSDNRKNEIAWLAKWLHLRPQSNLMLITHFYKGASCNIAIGLTQYFATIYQKPCLNHLIRC